MNKKLQRKCDTIVQRCEAHGMMSVEYDYLVKEIGKNKDLISYSNTMPDATRYIEQHGLVVTGSRTTKAKSKKPSKASGSVIPHDIQIVEITKHTDKNIDYLLSDIHLETVLTAFDVTDISMLFELLQTTCGVEFKQQRVFRTTGAVLNHYAQKKCKQQKKCSMFLDRKLDDDSIICMFDSQDIANIDYLANDGADAFLNHMVEYGFEWFACLILAMLGE